jgi:NDP-sugar pyrophosphorylase family protein/GNAT superfamily N-acetyltransferase
MENKNTNSNKYVVIMAGGSGTRMNSNVPKQLMKVGNDPMLVHLIKNSAILGYDVVLIVSNKNKEIIIQTLLDQETVVPNRVDKIDEIDRYRYKNITISICVQPIANGTGGAMIATKSFFLDKNVDDQILVLSADVPLITKSTITSMFEKINDSECCILVRDTCSNFGYGRVVVKNNEFVKIVEQKDATEEERLITLINTGVYAFKLGGLMESLSMIQPNNAQNEYYLTDCPKIIRERTNNMDNPVKLHLIDNNIFDETLGANTPEQLEHLREEYMKKFTIEMIDCSQDNYSDYNLMNLLRILEQLSSQTSLINQSVDRSIDQSVDLDAVRHRIKNWATLESNKKYIYVIKYESDTIVGTGSILIEDKLIHAMGRCGHIEDIVVDSDFRGLGLAKILMKKIIDCARDNQCYKVILNAKDDVKKFYESFGFYTYSNGMRLDLN